VDVESEATVKFMTTEEVASVANLEEVAYAFPSTTHAGVFLYSKKARHANAIHTAVHTKQHWKKVLDEDFLPVMLELADLKFSEYLEESVKAQFGADFFSKYKCVKTTA